MPRLKAQADRSARARQLVPVIDLTGGLDLRTAQSQMDPTRARTLTNWTLKSPGALSVRDGFIQHSTSNLGSGAVQGGARIYLNTAIPSVNSTAFTLVGWQGGVYHQTDSGGWGSTTPYYSTLSTANTIWFMHDRDLVAVMDGANAPRKSTNVSDWTLLGIAASTAASTLSTASGGNLSSAEFEISFGYKDRGLATYSNESTATSTVTLSATGAISVVVPNSTDAQVDAVVVYARNKTAGESIRRKASSLGASTGASSTVTLTSSNWTSNDEAPTDHDVPPTLSFGVVWKNRWWARHATVKNRLHFTQLFQPQSWPTLFYIDIPFERGDEIRALVALGDTLLVCGTTNLFVVTGQTSLDFEVRPALNAQEGAFGPYAVTVVENGIVHIGASGAYIFDGATDRNLTYDIDPAWQDMVDNANVSDLQKIAVVHHKEDKELRVAVPRRYPSGTYGEFVLDLARTRLNNDVPAWSDTDRTIGGYILWDGPETVTGNRGRLFSWHSSMGTIFEESTGVTANSSQMVSEYEGPGLTLGLRQARWVDMFGEYTGSTGNFAVEPVVDGVSQGSRTVPLTGSGGVYGTGVYGTATYAGTQRRAFHFFLPLAAQGRTLVSKAIYQGKVAFTWFTYSAGLVPETRPREFSD